MADDTNPAEPNVKAMIERVQVEHAASTLEMLTSPWCSRCCSAHPCSAYQLASALERAQADTARLDWLERMANEPGGLLLHDGSETGRCGLGLRPGLTDRTLRAAIDAAMSRDPSAT